MSGIVLFRPHCGSAGADFMSGWCDRCGRDRAYRTGEGDSCSIATASMAFDTSEDDYPREWRQDGPQGPRCTAFVPVDPQDQPRDPSAALRDLFA